MKMNGLIKASAFVLLLLVTLVVSVGCQSESSDGGMSVVITPNSQASGEGTSSGVHVEMNQIQAEITAPEFDDEALLEKWNSLVSAESDVKSVSLAKYTVRPLYSSIIEAAQIKTVDDEAKVAEILGILRERSISFEKLDASDSSLTIMGGTEGEQVISMSLKDSAGVEQISLRIFEGGDIQLLEPRSTEGNVKSYVLLCKVSFDGGNGDIFSAIDSFCDSKISE